MKLTVKIAKTLIAATAILMLATPVMAGNGHGPQDGTGFGPGTGDCLNG